MNVLSLFDGMSCGQLALQKAKIKVDNYYSCEIKDHAMKITQKNFPNTIQLGDVTKINLDKLPKIDLLIGGSPCQDFSQAMKGERKGYEGEKSGLFWEYVKIMNVLKDKNPKLKFFLENVKMLKQHEQTVTSAMGVYPIRINSQLVSGQLRDRFYWTNINYSNPPKDKDITLQSILTEGYTDREKSRCLLESDSRPLSTPVKMFHRYYSIGFTTVIFKDKEHYEKCVKHYEKNYKDMKATDIVCDSDVYDGVRYLNSEELEQLQNVPKGYTESITRNEAACLLGDGWTVNIISHIFKGLKRKVFFT